MPACETVLSSVVPYYSRVVKVNRKLRDFRVTVKFLHGHFDVPHASRIARAAHDMDFVYQLVVLPKTGFCARIEQRLEPIVYIVRTAIRRMQEYPNDKPLAKPAHDAHRQRVRYCNRVLAASFG